MADYLKDLISGAVAGGVKEIDYIVNTKSGGRIDIDASAAGSAAYETIRKTVMPTDTERITNNTKKINDSKKKIEEIKKSAKDGKLSDSQKKEIEELNKTISKSESVISEINEKQKTEAEKAAKKKAEEAKYAGLSKSDKNRKKKIDKYNAEIKEIKKNAKDGKLSEKEQKEIKELEEKISKTEKSLSAEEKQKKIDENLKAASEDYLSITIAQAAVENEDQKKAKKEAKKQKELEEEKAELKEKIDKFEKKIAEGKELDEDDKKKYESLKKEYENFDANVKAEEDALKKAAAELKKQEEENAKKKAELKAEIDKIEALKKNGTVLSEEQEEQLKKLKRQYEKFDYEERKKSIESYIVTTFTDGTLIKNLQNSFLQDFNSVISGSLVNVLKQNSYGELTDLLVTGVTELGKVTPNANQVIKVNANTKKKLQLDASNLIRNSVKNATDYQIGSIVDSITAAPFGNILGPKVKDTLTKIQTDTITQISYQTMDLINKNQQLVQAARYYYTYQQIMLLAEDLSFKSISNLLINTAKKIWVRERDKLIKEITSKISISASGVKINL